MRPAEVWLGFSDVPHSLQDEAQIPVADHKSGIDGNGSLKVRSRVLEFTPIAEDRPDVVQGGEIARLERESPLVMGQRIVGLTAPEQPG